ncbi:MAG: hypothetical protein FVQ81_15415 [Candidatus Glassbacteria bacterium]|nr:hypothetical protein [Candidatus Glassbacteria bacterium]
MKFSTLLALLCFALSFIPPLSAGTVDTRAPEGLNLPAEPAAEAGWSQQDGQYVLEPNQEGILTIPAWFDSNRPPRGECVVLEVEFLDNLAHPVRAEIYSALGTRQPWSELHRFGGTGDNRWKTARVPATSDFIWRDKTSGLVQFKLIAGDSGLRLRSFRLVAPQTGDEQRYNAETRQWVEREQRRGEIDPSYWEKTEAPVLTGDWAGSPLVPYVRNWMDLVMPVSAPRAGEAGAALSTRMFTNEFQTLQLGIYANGRDLSGVTVEVEPVRDDAGKVVATARVRVAQYTVDRGYTYPGFFVEPYPQLLWPSYAFDIPAGRSHLVYFIVRTEDKTARPGKYKTMVSVTAEGVPAEKIPLEVEILPLRLLSMDEAGIRMGGCTTNLLPEFELDFLSDYNHNMINIWYSGIRPELSGNGDGFELDFTVMDDWMAASRRQGINYHVYFLGGNPYGFPRTMHLPRTLANTVMGLDDSGWAALSMADPDNVPPRIAPLITEWARRFASHARQNDWPNVILTPFDEPAKWHQYTADKGMLHFIKPQFNQQVALLKAGAPELDIYGSIHHYYGGIEFLENVDIFCTNAVEENHDMPDEVRDGGKELWQYSGIGGMGFPAVARYTFGYYFASHGSVGSLCWAYNWTDRFDLLDAPNWAYAWNTPFDVIPAPYFEGMREAWDERRLLETLKKTADRKGADIHWFLSRLFAEIRMARGQGGRSTLNDFWERAKDEQIMEKWHNRLVDKLLDLNGL